MQLTLTLKMTTAQVVQTSVTVNNNTPIQDYFFTGTISLNLLFKQYYKYTRIFKNRASKKNQLLLLLDNLKTMKNHSRAD